MQQSRERLARRQTMGSRRSLVSMMCVLAVTMTAVAAQEIGTEVCVGSPTTYEFMFDFDVSCPGNIVGGNVVDTQCLVTAVTNQTNPDEIPVKVSTIQVLELGVDSSIISNTVKIGSFVNGDTFTYNSVSEGDLTIDLVPSGIQLNLQGENAAGERILNNWFVDFNNGCDSCADSGIEIGDEIGWTVVTDIAEPRVEYCPAVSEAPVTRSPSDPTMAPILPTMEPTGAPVTSAPISPAPVIPTLAPIVPTDFPTVGPTESPVEDTPAPVADTAAPVEDTPAPVADTAAPVEDTPAPVADTAAPVVGTPSPITDAPFADTPAPVVGTPSPITDAPFADTPAPVSSSGAPVAGLPTTDAPFAETPPPAAPETPEPTAAPKTKAPDAAPAPKPTFAPFSPVAILTPYPTYMSFDYGKGGKGGKGGGKKGDSDDYGGKGKGKGRSSSSSDSGDKGKGGKKGGKKKEKKVKEETEGKMDKHHKYKKDKSDDKSEDSYFGRRRR